MLLKMKLNLGMIDAARLGIPAYLDGEVIDADKIAAESLLKCGWAEAVDESLYEQPQYEQVQYEPPAPEPPPKTHGKGK